MGGGVRVGWVESRDGGGQGQSSCAGLWLIQTELERDLYRDREKLACTISYESFQTTT